jgi:3D (Asp-Asp-Asp) domain-containing protein
MTPILTTSLAILFAGFFPNIDSKPLPVKSENLRPDQARKKGKVKGDDSANNPRVMTVRVTVYWRNGSGTDGWTACGESSTGRPLRDRRSAAVDPKIIPYGSKIVLPEAGKSLDAIDTGSDVVKRKAAKRMGCDVPVVDVYFDNKREALNWANHVPMFMEAHVYDQ